jgi:hypothetical protein
MIKQLCGTITFHEFAFRSPKTILVLLSEDTVFELTKSNYDYYNFYLKSKVLDDKSEYTKWLSISTLGLGFLLDTPIFESYSMELVETTYLYSSENLKDGIEFECVEGVLKPIPGEKPNFVWAHRQTLKFKRIEIEQFIKKLFSSEILRTAATYYLEALDEPTLFLVSLYKAYEVLKDVYNLPRSQIRKFTRFANDPSLYLSRHASGKTQSFRSFSNDEEKFCQDTVKSVIIQYSKNI